MRFVIVIFVLIIANLLVFLWRVGAPQGIGSGVDPQRVMRQFRADTLTVLNSEETMTAVSNAMPAAPSSSCVVIRPLFDEAVKDIATRIAAAGIVTSPQVRDVQLSSLWMVYMGRFADAETLRQKLAELKGQGVNNLTSLQSPEFRYGISLGEYESRNNAVLRATALNQRGVTSARVVEVIAPPGIKELRYNGVSPNAVDKIAEVEPRAANCPAP